MLDRIRELELRELEPAPRSRFFQARFREDAEQYDESSGKAWVVDRKRNFRNPDNRPQAPELAVKGVSLGNPVVIPDLIGSPIAEAQECLATNQKVE